MNAPVAGGAGEPAEAGMSVRVLFKVADEAAARTVASRLIDSAHEIANLPECECDLDVAAEWVPPAA